MWVGVLSFLLAVGAVKGPKQENVHSESEDHSKPLVQLEKCDRDEYFARGFVSGKDTEYRSDWEEGYQFSLNPSSGSSVVKKMRFWIVDSEDAESRIFSSEYASWPVEELILVSYSELLSDCIFCFAVAELVYEGGAQEAQCAWFTQAPRHGVTVGNGLDGDGSSANMNFGAEYTGAGDSSGSGGFGSSSGGGGVCGALSNSEHSPNAAVSIVFGLGLFGLLLGFHRQKRRY